MITVRSPVHTMRSMTPFMIFLSALTVASCNLFNADPGSGNDVGFSSSSEQGSMVTRNVSYTGVIDLLGISIEQQGTHKLTLSDGQFLVVESTDVSLDLNAYIGMSVEIRGSVQPTVEAGGMLLRAEEVTVLDESVSSASSESSTSSSPESTSSSFSSTSTTSTSSSSSASSAPSVISSSVSAAPASVSPSASSISSAAVSSSVSANAGASEQHTLLMAKQQYSDPSLWTQQYCTTHIAFCVPVHKNWYFKSFGATTSNRWHVEFGMEEIDELGDGAILLNLVAGSSASMNASDGEIKTQGNDIIAFKDWNDGTHFEIIADARLQEAVSYMLARVSPYTPAD